MTRVFVCTRCKVEKPESSFTRKKRGPKPVHSWCKPCCVEAKQEKYPEVREKLRERHLKFSYDLSTEDYNDLLEKQKGVCQICGLPERCLDKLGNPQALSVDHCHTSGSVRGLLCRGCNTGIGQFMEDPERLRKAIEYLEHFKNLEKLKNEHREGG